MRSGRGMGENRRVAPGARPNAPWRAKFEAVSLNVRHARHAFSIRVSGSQRGQNSSAQNCSGVPGAQNGLTTVLRQRVSS
jgi:hypothetical protein